MVVTETKETESLVEVEDRSDEEREKEVSRNDYQVMYLFT